MQLLIRSSAVNEHPNADLILLFPQACLHLLVRHNVHNHHARLVKVVAPFIEHIHRLHGIRNEQVGAVCLRGYGYSNLVVQLVIAFPKHIVAQKHLHQACKANLLK